MNSSWNALYAVALFSMGLFALSYYRNCYRKGYRFDIWHAYLFLFCVLPNMIMLPFAKSELNAVVVGNDLGGIVAVLPTVFLITTAGYAATLIGGTLWQLRLGVGLRRNAIRLLDILPRCSRMLMSSRDLLVFEALLCLFLQALALTIYFSHSGFGFDLRGYTFENPALRPIAQIVSNFSVLVGSHCLARYVERKERILLVCALMLTVGLFFFGSRANLLAIYLGVGTCYLVQRKTRISLLRLFGFFLVLIFFGFYLGNVRAGQYSVGEFVSSLVILLFYGNNFSDLRDFAWVYAAWDHSLWFGKTYLAAIMSMVPRFVSQFRDTWSSGAAMDLTVGLDPTVHPGLRPGLFGEGFFNFGWAGAIGVGIVVGVLLRRVDIDVKKALNADRPSMTRALASTMLITLVACVSISATLSSLYVMASIYLFSWLCLRARAMFD